ncbi:hypothetical protein RIU10_10710, partial [Riemerella anatipestifer]|uniref:hypothetical protein n=1 Tax=Riemerella anatipestifer TaxID=34085 RepID=UPI002857FC29
YSKNNILIFSLINNSCFFHFIMHNGLIEFLKDKTGNMDCRTVTVNHENLKFNCHFFLENEIEFDIWPDEIKSELDFGKLISFMFDISFTLQKQITLTYENDTTLPLIKIDAKRNLLKIITEMEINHLVKHDNIILPIMEDFKRKLFQSATEIHKPTKSKENKW